MNLSNTAIELVEIAQKSLEKDFGAVDKIAYHNQLKILSAFQKHQISPRHFASTTGYGYDDVGRDALCMLFADIFNCQSAIVSPLITGGTQALSLCMFAILRPKDTLLSITGAPYDTLTQVISGDGIGSLKEFGIKYNEIDLINGKFDYDSITKYITKTSTKMIFIGRSRGYSWRNAITISDIKKVIEHIKSINKSIIVMVDNCYGEFVDTVEPTDVGADIIAGSLIKNPGGGITPTGGYICGREDLIKLVGCRLTAPSVGMEVGSYNSSYMPFYQGIFLAPHVVANAIKGSLLFGKVFHDLGYRTMPIIGDYPADIIRSIQFDSAEQLISFCRSIQQSSPVDSHVTPYPWDMPGYENKVIMAAGAFVQGSSIELSADSPIREPFIAYVQGGLTYEHAKIAVINALSNIGK